MASPLAAILSSNHLTMRSRRANMASDFALFRGSCQPQRYVSAVSVRIAANRRARSARAAEGVFNVSLKPERPRVIDQPEFAIGAPQLVSYIPVVVGISSSNTRMT